MRVRFTDAAERDIEAIGDYIAADRPLTAAGFARDLWAACEALADYPERFAVFTEHGGRSFRRRVFSSYAIFYVVLEDVVEISRVLHSARDQRRLLFPND